MAPHLNPDALERLLAGELPPLEELAALTHLAGCRHCAWWARPAMAAALLADDGGTSGDAVDDAAYDAAIDRAWARTRAARPRIRRDRRRGVAIRARREAKLPLRWHERSGWAPAEGLFAASFALRYSDLARMLALAVEADVAATYTKPDEARGPALVADLQARARAELGNAYRLKDDFDQSERAHAQAAALLAQGTGDPLIAARVADLRASFLADRRRFAEADALLEEVYVIYTELGERHLAGRARISQGIYRHYAGRPHEGHQLIEEGLARIDVEKDPNLAVSARQAAIHALADGGEAARAGEALLSSGLRQALAGDPLSLIDLRGLEGKIQLGLGRLTAAERAFAEARQGYLEHRQLERAAIATLEVVKVQLLQGKNHEVRQLTEESYDTFVKLGIQPEAQLALGLLREVARHGCANVDFVEHTAHYLEELESQPQLRLARD